MQSYISPFGFENKLIVHFFITPIELVGSDVTGWASPRWSWPALVDTFAFADKGFLTLKFAERETGLEPATTNLGSGDSASTQTQHS
jgi:hypothetical protein